jgi:hypothetical protein
MQKVAYLGFFIISTLIEMYTKNTRVVKFRHTHETTKYSFFFAYVLFTNLLRLQFFLTYQKELQGGKFQGVQSQLGYHNKNHEIHMIVLCPES